MPVRRTAVLSGRGAGRSSAPGADRAAAGKDGLSGAPPATRGATRPGFELCEIEERVVLAEVVVLHVSRSSSRSCAAGTSTTPRPMRANSARRRAPTVAVSMGRPCGQLRTGVQAPSGGGVGLGRPVRRARCGNANGEDSDRMGSEAIARTRARQLDAYPPETQNYAMTLPPHSRRALPSSSASASICSRSSRSSRKSRLAPLHRHSAGHRRSWRGVRAGRCSIFLAERAAVRAAGRLLRGSDHCNYVVDSSATRS